MKMRFSKIVSLLLALALLIGGFYIFSGGTQVQADSRIAESAYKTLKVGMGGQQVRQMQAVLQELGYYEGSVHGNFSRDFEAAVKAFQADFGLDETGKIDYEMYSLLMEEFTDFPQATPAKTQPTKAPKQSGKTPQPTQDPYAVEEDGYYTDKEHVAAYLRKYEKLPKNYITKNDARKLGWNGSRSGLWDVAYGMSIGGDKFGNYEEILPVKRGRQYYECDIDFDGERANAKRIVYSNDGLIFYTEDHYETFEEMLAP